MSRFTFICEDDYTSSKTTVEFDGVTLSDVLPEFERFLRGAGFHFKGILDFIDEDEESPQQNIYESDWPFSLEEKESKKQSDLEPPHTVHSNDIILNFGDPQAALDLTDTITIKGSANNV